MKLRVIVLKCLVFNVVHYLQKVQKKVRLQEFTIENNVLYLLQKSQAIEWILRGFSHTDFTNCSRHFLILPVITHFQS